MALHYATAKSRQQALLKWIWQSPRIPQCKRFLKMFLPPSSGSVILSLAHLRTLDRAFSSGGERFPDTEEVRSSNLLTPTKCSQLRGYVSGLFCNMRKPLSIGMFVRARFETGLFRFPSGEPAHAAWLSRRLPGKLISAGSCGCASGGQPGMSAHPTAFRFSVRRYRTNPVFCRARPGGCPSKRS